MTNESIKAELAELKAHVARLEAKIMEENGLISLM